jgi:hypothetical protein
MKCGGFNRRKFSNVLSDDGLSTLQAAYKTSTKKDKTVHRGERYATHLILQAEFSYEKKKPQSCNTRHPRPQGQTKRNRTTLGGRERHLNVARLYTKERVNTGGQTIQAEPVVQTQHR